MSRTIAIVDAGSGNLRSVEKAVAHVGGTPIVTGDPETIRTADRVIVPGQGAFGRFVSAIQQNGLAEALDEVIRSGRPFFGICLGMQVLFDRSEEQGPVDGFGWIPGDVVRFRPDDPDQKVPHMGWNQIQKTADDPLLSGIDDGAYVYFVHSYYVVPKDPSVIALTADYGGRFCAAVRKDNVFACQFHPEKSQNIGLRMLANFVEVS